MSLLILEPIFHETVWGGTRLFSIYNNSCRKLAHLYSVCCKQEQSNKILNGIYSGKSFLDVFHILKQRYGMQDYNEFPLTIAIVDAADNLSIQVHPDDKTANVIENIQKGKRESWYFILPPSEGRIIGGCTARTKTELEEKMYGDQITKIVKNVQVKGGDYVFSPSGTLHALTKGCLAYEIEEGSNFTYRLYDYGRMDENGQVRELHMEKALVSLDLNREVLVRQYDGEREIIEETYATKKLKNVEYYENTGSNLECVTILKGEIIVEGIAMKMGMSAILEPGDRLKCKIQECIVARSIVNSSKRPKA